MRKNHVVVLAVTLVCLSMFSQPAQASYGNPVSAAIGGAIGAVVDVVKTIVAPIIDFLTGDDPPDAVEPPTVYDLDDLDDADRAVLGLADLLADEKDKDISLEVDDPLDDELTDEMLEEGKICYYGDKKCRDGDVFKCASTERVWIRDEYCANGCSGGECIPDDSFELLSVTPEEDEVFLGDELEIEVEYDSSFSGTVDFAVDLVRGSFPSCRKLHCGAPSSDTECDEGCDGGRVIGKSVKEGEHSLTLKIDIPDDGEEGTYWVNVGAWDDPWTDDWDFMRGGDVEVVSPGIQIDSIKLEDDMVGKGERFSITTVVDNVQYGLNLGGYEAEVRVTTRIDGREFTDTFTDSCDFIGACHLYYVFKWIGSAVVGYDIEAEQTIYSDSLGTKTIKVKAKDMNSGYSDTKTATVKVLDPYLVQYWAEDDLGSALGVKDALPGAKLLRENDLTGHEEKYDKKILVGAQEANPVFRDRVRDGSFEDVTYDDNGYIYIQRSGDWFGVAGWSKGDTEASVEWIAENGLPDETVREARPFDVEFSTNVEGFGLDVTGPVSTGFSVVGSSYTIGGMVPGAYTATFSKPGYITVSEPFTVPEELEVEAELRHVPVITIMGPNSFTAGEGAEYDVTVEYGEGYTLSARVYAESYLIEEILVESGDMIGSGLFEKSYSVPVPNTYPPDTYFLEVSVKGDVNVEEILDFEVELPEPRITDFQVEKVRYKECWTEERTITEMVMDDPTHECCMGGLTCTCPTHPEMRTESSFVCEEKEADGSEVDTIYGGSTIDFSYRIENIMHRCMLGYPSCYGNLMYDIMTSVTLTPESMLSPLSQTLTGTRAYGMGFDDYITHRFTDVKLQREASGDFAEFYTKDYMAGSSLSMQDVPVRIRPNELPEITDIKLCYIMPDDSGACGMPIETDYLFPVLNQDTIEKGRPIALYFRVQNLHKNGQAMGYVDMAVDTRPSSLVGEGEKLTNGVVVNKSTEDGIPVIWVFKIDESGLHDVHIKVTDLQDGDEGEGSFTLFISINEVGEVPTPFQYASGELEETYPHIMDIYHNMTALKELIDSGELSGDKLQNAKENYALLNVLYHLISEREAEVLYGGTLEVVPSWLAHIGNAIGGFLNGLGMMLEGVANALVNFVSDPLGSLAAMGEWIWEHPIESIEIALGIAAIAVLILALPGVGLISAGTAAVAFGIMDIATILIVGHRFSENGGHLETLDWVTLALVAAGNAGVMFRGLRAVSSEGSRVAKILDSVDNSIAALKGKIGSGWQSLKNSLGGADNAALIEARGFADDLNRAGERAFGEGFRDNIAKIWKKLGSIKAFKGLGDDALSKALKLADDLDAATMQKVLKNRHLTGYIDDVYKAHSVLGKSAVQRMLDMPWLSRGMRALTDDQMRAAWKVLSDNEELLLKGHNAFQGSWIERTIDFKHMPPGKTTPMAVYKDGLKINIDKLDEVVKYGDIMISHEFGHVNHLGPRGWPKLESGGTQFGFKNKYMEIPKLDNAAAPKIAEELVADKVGILRDAAKTQKFAEWTESVLPNIREGFKSGELADNMLAYDRALRLRISIGEIKPALATQLDEIVRNGINTASPDFYLTFTDFNLATKSAKTWIDQVKVFI